MSRPLYLNEIDNDQSGVAFDRANHVFGFVFQNGRFQPVAMPGSRVMVDVTFGGNPVRMMLDTGSPMTVLDPRVFNGHPLVGQPTPFGYPFAGTGGMGIRLNVAQISVAKSTQFNFPVVVGDLQVMRMQGEQIWGILGDDFLSHYKVTIDYKNQRLRLE